MPRIILVLALLVLSANVVFAADMVDNPAYTKWAKFKVGTYVKYKKTVEAAGINTESEIIKTLVEVSPSKVVVETVENIIVSGKVVADSKTIFDCPAQIKKIVATVGIEQKVTPVAKPQKGEEEIEVAGVMIKCKTMKVSMENDGVNDGFITWTNEDIPEFLVKSESTMSKPTVIRTVMVLIEKNIK